MARARRSPTETVTAVKALPRRDADAHKGNFGRVLVLGGSTGMAGAPALVGLAALRSGAGLVTIAVPVPSQQTVATLCPCATTIGLPSTRDGQIEPRASLRLLAGRGLFQADGAQRPDVLITGPGVGTEPDARYAPAFWALVDAFRSAGIAAVIDADALNLARRRNGPAPTAWDARPHPRTVITPHPGELARMHGLSIRDVQADREGYAVRTAQAMSAHKSEGEEPVIVLKGGQTIVTDGRRVYTNRTGNPGMATGGSGDVLGGVIGALIGQGLTRFDAAINGVYVHGMAGDLAAARYGQVSMIATDIIDCLPDAFRDLEARPARGRHAKTNR